VTEDVVILLSESGASIEGVVETNDRNSPNGTTVYLVDAESEIQMLASAQSLGQRARQTQRVGEDGAFLFEQIPEGTYVVFVEHELYPRAQSQLIFLEADQRFLIRDYQA